MTTAPEGTGGGGKPEGGGANVTTAPEGTGGGGKPEGGGGLNKLEVISRTVGVAGKPYNGLEYISRENTKTNAFLGCIQLELREEERERREREERERRDGATAKPKEAWSIFTTRDPGSSSARGSSDHNKPSADHKEPGDYPSKSSLVQIPGKPVTAWGGADPVDTNPSPSPSPKTIPYTRPKSLKEEPTYEIEPC